jgi:hypothetical protein
MKQLPRIEPLEERIAPARILNPFTVTYQNYETNSSGVQIQGDTVVVKISKPLFTSPTAAAHILEFTANPNSTTIISESFTGNSTAEFLGEINLQGNTAAEGMNISVSVIPQAGIGQDTVNVGDINAGQFNSHQLSATGNIDLGSIYIEGNLGGITAGDDFSVPGAIQSLTALSMSGDSIVLGTIGKINIAGNFTGSLDDIGYAFGSIGVLNIGGSLMGTGDTTNDTQTGLIEFAGKIGRATIGSITGTAESNTGEILGTGGGIGVLHIEGSITGGGPTDSSGNAVQDSGAVFTNGNIGQLIVDGSITGGGAELSGLVSVNGASIGLARISGVITGSSGQDSGIISVSNNINTLQVLGSSNGVSITGSSGVDSGFITVGGVIGNATVMGSITGGSAGTAADNTVSPAATAVQGFTGVIEAPTIHSLTIGGSLIGGAPNAASTVSSTDNTPNATANTSGAILVNSAGSINITGSIMGNGGPENGVIMPITTIANGVSTAPAVTQYNSITIGGALMGGAGAISGSIFSNGQHLGLIKSLHIAGAVTGSSGSQSGEIYSTSGFGTVTIGGDLAGGSGASSGEIFGGGPLTNLHITGNVTGGSRALSGYVEVDGTLGALLIGGNVTGGSANNTGEIVVGGGLTTATLQGSLEGNAGGTPLSSTTTIEDAGYIQAGHIGMLNINGNVTAGTNTAGDIVNSGAIRSFTDIASLNIGGMVTGVAGNPVIISAQQGPGTSAHLTTDLAIGSLTVKGTASYVDVLAGYSPTLKADSGAGALGTPSDGSAQIGTVTFMATLSAGNIVAGASPDSNGQFGTSGVRALLPRAGGLGILSSIANIVVAGTAVGDSTQGDSFGIVAEMLGSVEVNGVVAPTGSLTPGVPVAVTGNLYLLEPLVT